MKLTPLEMAKLKAKRNTCKTCRKSERVDGEIIKEDIWYTMRDGEIVEVEE